MAEKLNFRYLDTPIGRLRLVSNGASLVRIEFEGRHGSDGEQGSDSVLEATAAQLEEYFAGQRRRFSLPLGASGTHFQQQVWDALVDIPYGQRCSYGDIANRIGNRKAVRAVGAANGRNPIPIVVPCHRVVGSNGKLTGFAGGLSVKEKLLELECASADSGR